MDDQSEPERNLPTVELSPREVRLLLKYGCPWPEDEEKLRASLAVEGVHRVCINAYWIEMMIADINRPAKTIRSGALLEVEKKTDPEGPRCSHRLIYTKIKLPVTETRLSQHQDHPGAGSADMQKPVDV